MSDPCSKETNDKVMERIRKEFVATPTVEELEAEIERLRTALLKISYGEGRYSDNQLTHAKNTIQDMIDLAKEALDGE
jgi:hypothetical protein